MFTICNVFLEQHINTHWPPSCGRHILKLDNYTSKITMIFWMLFRCDMHEIFIENAPRGHFVVPIWTLIFQWLVLLKLMLLVREIKTQSKNGLSIKQHKFHNRIIKIPASFNTQDIKMSFLNSYSLPFKMFWWTMLLQDSISCSLYRKGF